MIDELRISNLGVIAQAHVTFGEHMSVVTGETGAGKTMTVTALQMLMGEKVDPARVRVGADKAVVEGTFILSASSPAVKIVQDAGGDVEPGPSEDTVSLILARHISAHGRSRAFAGGHLVPARVLSRCAQHMITLHGQADQLRLRSLAAQRAALDTYGGGELSKELAAYTQAWNRLVQAREEYEDFVHHAQKISTERMAMRMLLERVDSVKPHIGEEDQLKEEAARLSNVQTLRESMACARAALSNDQGSGALEMIAQAREQLSSTHDRSIEALADQLADVDSIVADVYENVSEQLDHLSDDPERLEAIQQRRAQLRAVERELGMSVAEMLEQAQVARRELDESYDLSQRKEQLMKAVHMAQEKARAQAHRLHACRQEAAQRLSQAVNEELSGLYMKNAVFSATAIQREELTSWGMDEVHFLLTPHAGAEAHELSRVASGGEMSRIMLAIEVQLASRNGMDGHTFIFDEIDAGIGGEAGLAVGRRLAKLGQQTQVLCVTHLPQVAAYAHNHIVVEKLNDDHGALTNVHHVSGDSRLAELARMLSGHAESEAARLHASELLASAGVQ